MEVLTSLLTILIIVSLGILSRKAGIFKAEHAKTPVILCVLFRPCLPCSS